MNPRTAKAAIDRENVNAAKDSYTTNDYQKWCDRSAFGSHKQDFKDAYRDANKQFEAYAESLKDAL